MWEIIVNYCQENLQLRVWPKRITIDFEAAMIKTLREAFPFCRIHCCFFHFGQNIYKKIVGLGLKKKYAKDVNFSLEVKKVIALAFLKPSLIPSEFEKLKVSGPKKLEKFYDWFEKF